MIRRTRKPGFETLEGRKVCAGVYLTGGTLHVDGTASRDVVHIAKDFDNTGSTIRVRMNGNAWTFNAEHVDTILGTLGDGNDVWRSPTVNERTIVRGGRNRDLIIVGEGEGNRINGGLHKDSVRSYGTRTTFVMRDGDYDRVFNPQEGDVFIGDQFNFRVWHDFLDHENVNAFRGKHLTFRKVDLPGYGPERLFYNANIWARGKFYKHYDGLQSMSEGVPPSQGGLRAYYPLGGSVHFVGFHGYDERYLFEPILVM